jgi:hypothetical protein
METSFGGAMTGIELLCKIEIALWLYDLGCWSIFPSSGVDFGYGAVSMGPQQQSLQQQQQQQETNFLPG